MEEQSWSLTVRFGPAATPTLPRAVVLAREHADSLEEVEGGAWRATFALGEDQVGYG